MKDYRNDPEFKELEARHLKQLEAEKALLAEVERRFPAQVGYFWVATYGGYTQMRSGSGEEGSE